MSLATIVYRDMIVRAVLGRPAAGFQVADNTELERICQHLSESEDAKAILRAKGHGKVFMTIDEVARTVPDAVNGE